MENHKIMNRLTGWHRMNSFSAGFLWRVGWGCRILGYLTVGACLAVVLPMVGADAQYQAPGTGVGVPGEQTIVVGGEGRPSVEVDLSVLNELGRPLTAPQLLMPLPSAPRSRLSLKPPEGVQPLVSVRPARKASTLKAPTTATPPRVAALPRRPAPPAPMPPATRPPRLTAAPPPPPTATAPTLRPAPPPAAAKAAPRAPAPTRTAALPPPKAPAPATEVGTTRVRFDGRSTKLSGTARQGLEGLAGKLKGNETLRIQLLAYAEGTAETANEARRTSLSRALVVRSFLIQQGVRSTRIDVRALGNKTEEDPKDRVDMLVVKR